MPSSTSTVNLEEILATAYGKKPQASRSSRVPIAKPDSDDDSSEHSECSEIEQTHSEVDDDDLESSSPTTAPEKNKFDSPIVTLEDSDFDDDAYENSGDLCKARDPDGDDAGLRDRCWFITYFTDDLWRPDFTVHKDFRYAVYTREIAPTTKRAHYHCYVELYEGHPMGWVKKRLNIPSAHFAIRKGTQKQAIMYCTKLRTRYPGFVPIHWGTPANQGYRTDQDWIAEAALNGATFHEVLKVGKGNAFRMGGMFKLAQQTVLGINAVDNLVLARRQAAATGAGTVPMLSDVTGRDNEERNHELHQSYIQGKLNDDRNQALKEALTHIALGPNAGDGQPSAVAKALREKVKKIKAAEKKEPQIKAYAKPTGAMYERNILPSLQSWLDTFNLTWKIQDGVPYKRAVAMYVKGYDDYLHGLLPQYCKDPSDVDALFRKAKKVIEFHREQYIEHIDSLFENDD